MDAVAFAWSRRVPLKDLKFRCAKCGSRRTDFVVMSRDALAVQPWRAEGAETGAATFARAAAMARRGLSCGAHHAEVEARLLAGVQPWRQEAC
jgi:hypothetical protein